MIHRLYFFICIPLLFIYYSPLTFIYSHLLFIYKLSDLFIIFFLLLIPLIIIALFYPIEYHFAVLRVRGEVLREEIAQFKVVDR